MPPAAPPPLTLDVETDVPGVDGERAARPRAAWLARFPEESPDPVLRLSLEATLLYANPAARAALGEAIGEVGAAVSPALGEPVKRAAARGERISCEIACGGRTFLMTCSPQASDVNVFGYDVTERKLAEGALREREEILQLFVEHSPAAVAMLDREMRYLRVSRRWLSDYRLGGQRVVGRSHYELFPEVPERWKAIHRRCLAGAVEVCEEEPFARGDGSLDWVRWEIHPWRTAEGAIGGIMILSEVITERRRAAEVLREEEVRSRRSRERAQRLVQLSAGLVGETSPDGLAQRIADAARELVSARMAVVGHVHPAGPLTISATSGIPRSPSAAPPGQSGALLDLVDGRETVRLTDADLRAHPGWREGLGPVLQAPPRGILGARLVARDGSTSGLILVSDPTAPGDFTAEDESLMQELAVVASLAVQQLEARVRLEEEDRNKCGFLAMLSHELRNPLAPIRNSLFILERAAPGGEQSLRARAIIGRQVEHMTRLIEDLLDVTRIASGKIRLQRERIELSELVRRTVEDHRPLLASSGVELELDAGDRALWVDADGTRIVQVVGNLLQNAIKFAGRGGRVRVDVTTDDPTGRVVVRVRDTGVGIDPELLPQLFQPFKQAPSTLDRSRGGLGLGLALVKGLIELHGGDVEARSEGPGLGAEFTVRLPLATPAARPAGRAVATPGRRRRRVLVIEDNLDAAESLREVLELDEHEVAVAHDGPEGIAMARELRPEVVLCDIGLPGLDGYEVARALRSDEALRGTLLVALSGYVQPEDRQRSLEAGFEHHLAKPPDLEELAALLGGPSTRCQAG